MNRKNSRPFLVVLLLLLVGMLALLIGGVAWLASGQSGMDASAFGITTSTPYGSVQEQASPTASPTPFQPLPSDTPTPTATFTPTATYTPTATATSTSTPTPTETSTPLPTDTPEPTETPVPVALPADGLPLRASVDGVVGYAQSHNLTCESSSAVDWARYFGVSIGEMEFQSALPVTDNPETGFVGNIDGNRGRIPPHSYGVHAVPVARVLRDYGLSASAVKGYSFEKLRRQIANGNPVIVWVIGNVWSDGNAVEYTASDGSSTIVAPFEHTVIVTGYDEYGVSIVDGDMVYWRTIDGFLSSWDVLGNMAIIWR